MENLIKIPHPWYIHTHSESPLCPCIYSCCNKWDLQLPFPSHKRHAPGWPIVMCTFQPCHQTFGLQNQGWYIIKRIQHTPTRRKNNYKSICRWHQPLLSEEDNLDKVHKILEEWCSASGAKFNIEKTEIIPIGSPAHCTRMTETWQLNVNEQQPLNTRIRIAKDHDAVRILRAWLGNETEAMAPWEPIIDKINKLLTRFSKLHPTLDGWKLIIQMIIGGYTQS